MMCRTKEDWTEVWKQNNIGWHQDTVNKNLINNIEALTNGRPNLRLLVPFCGKTLDMIWLVKQGHTVIGVELIRKAIEDFFTENSVPYSREAINMAPNGAYVYTAFDGKLKIFECDYFSFPSSLAGGKVDGIWDCHALGAVSPDKRKDYIKTSLDLLQPSPHGRILHEAFTYVSQEKFKGPPYSVSVDDLRAWYGDSFEVQLLSKDVKPEEACLKFGVSCLELLDVSIAYKS